MIKNLLKLILLTMTILFLIVAFTYYLSDKNIDLIKKNRKIDPFNSYKISLELPILRNNTDDVIEFNSRYENLDNKRIKRNFWNLIK